MLGVTAGTPWWTGLRPTLQPRPPVSTAAYRIRVTDVLTVGFFRTETLNQSRSVGPDGEIQLLLIGRVHVVGRTLAEIDFRRSYGILVLAIRRGGKTVQLPDGDER